MSDDAEFDAFLNGEGELALRLQGLAQPGPSAALDAAILANARAAMAQDARPVAANDSGDTSAMPRLAPGLGWRWRMPAGIAAAVLVGVFAKQSYQASSDARQVVVPVPTESEAVMAPMAPPPVAAAPEEIVAGKPAVEPVPAPPQKAAAPQQKPSAPLLRAKPAAQIAAAPAPAPAPAPVVAPAPPALAPETAALSKTAPPSMADKADSAAVSQNYYSPPPERAQPMARYSSAPVKISQQKAAPSAAAADDGASSELNRILITGRAKRMVDSSSSASTNTAGELAKPVMAAPPAPVGVMAEHDWLERIKSLLAQGKQAEAVADWKAFREVYPNYPVPDETRSKLE